MEIYVDIDETICTSNDNLDYSLAKPYPEKIKKINSLYDKGHKIIYWTARGRKTGIDWYNETKKQLNDWGAKYHILDTSTKPAYDLLICDKTISDIEEVILEEF